MCVWGEGEMESVNSDIMCRITDMCRIKAWEYMGVYGLCNLLFKLDPPLFPVSVQRASKADKDWGIGKKHKNGERFKGRKKKKSEVSRRKKKADTLLILENKRTKHFNCLTNLCETKVVSSAGW